MIPSGQSLIRTGALAKELGVSDSTLCKWGKTKLKAARHSRGVYLVAKLRDLGVFPPIQSPEVHQSPVNVGKLVVVTVEELRAIVREEVGRAVGHGR